MYFPECLITIMIIISTEVILPEKYKIIVKNYLRRLRCLT